MTFHVHRPVCRIRQDATASLILLWKVTAAGFQQCSLIDGRSVTLLQAPGGLVLLEEMLALGQNHFIGESRKSPPAHSGAPRPVWGHGSVRAVIAVSFVWVTFRF